MLFDLSKPDQFDVASVRDLTTATSNDHRIHVMQGRLGRLFMFNDSAAHGVQSTNFALGAAQYAADGDMMIVENRTYMLFDVQKLPGYNNTYRAHAIEADLKNGIGHDTAPRCPDLSTYGANTLDCV